MAEGSKNSVTFEHEIEREKSRQKRNRQGGKHTQLSDHLEQHQYDQYYDQVEVLLPKKPKTDEPLSENFTKLVQDLLNNVKRCPFHEDQKLEQRTSEKGWDYYRCPIHWCVFWCGANVVDDWLQRLPSSLHPSYKERPDENGHIRLPFTCFCTHEDYHHLRMYKSGPKKRNANRFFLTCQYNKKCKFFQWLDEPISTSNSKAWY